MKKVLSIITAPFRFIGRLLLKLLRSLRVLGRPFRVLAKLRGRKLLVAVGVIAVLLVGAILVLKPGESDETAVRKTLDRFAEATRGKDYQTLCDELYSSNLVGKIRAAGLPCEVALRTGLEDRRNPQLTVLALEVNGDNAAARARSSAAGEVASVDTIKLVREGEGWRVDSLSEPSSRGSATP